jgi:hypothetical protein
MLSRPDPVPLQELLRNVLRSLRPSPVQSDLVQVLPETLDLIKRPCRGRRRRRTAVRVFTSSRHAIIGLLASPTCVGDSKDRGAWHCGVITNFV